MKNNNEKKKIRYEAGILNSGKHKIFSETKVQLQGIQGRIDSNEILIKDIEEKHREKIKRQKTR